MVVCIDEKTSLQPRPRKAPTLPAQPQLPVRVEHEYQRKGALNLFAAFDTRTGKVWGQTYERKRQQEFIAFLEYLDRDFPAHITKVHVVLDNLKMHKGKKVQDWLANHPRFVFHHPPVHCSWMNQVEQWFSVLQRKRLKIADFADKQALRSATTSVHCRVECSCTSIQLDNKVGCKNYGEMRWEPTHFSQSSMIFVPLLR